MQLNSKKIDCSWFSALLWQVLSEDKDFKIIYIRVLEDWQPSNFLPELCFEISRFFRAVISRGSSKVENFEQVKSLNCRSSCPNSLVSASRSASVVSVCIRSLAKACHSAVRYSSFITRRLWWPSRRPSNVGIMHSIKESKLGIYWQG